jgi:hypothetical protein
VVNRLTPAAANGRPRNQVQQALAMQPQGGGPGGIQRVQYQGPVDGEPGPATYGDPGPGAGAYGAGPVPSYGHPGSGSSHVVYDQPHLPAHAWPSYAAYPNYASVGYPTQYSASAWPYIGPFYPYPQVPLGWRKVTLEWDDGFWNLNFNSRTDRWWWFLDYRNW